MSKINVYLHFNGNCTEAMQFYQHCLGGKLTITTVAESPMANDWPPHMQRYVLHASLIDHDLVLLASDMGGPEEIIHGNSISLSLSCTTLEQTENYFYHLSQGGVATRPLHEFFNGTIGSLTDKYGKHWVLYCEKK